MTALWHLRRVWFWRRDCRGCGEKCAGDWYADGPICSCCRRLLASYRGAAGTFSHLPAPTVWTSSDD
jgi:hypothetical protein